LREVLGFAGAPPKTKASAAGVLRRNDIRFMIYSS